MTKPVEGLSKINVTPVLTRHVAFTQGLSSPRKANLTVVAGAGGAGADETDRTRRPADLGQDCYFGSGQRYFSFKLAFVTFL